MLTLCSRCARCAPPSPPQILIKPPSIKQIQGLDDVYTGGRQPDQLAQDVEVALARKDEYGRILTPKEAFRQLCHDFHGIYPSRNSKAKRQRQVAEEMAQKAVASGAAGEGRAVRSMKALQAGAATPYVVLSGTVRPGQSRDAASGYATVDRSAAMQQQQAAMAPGTGSVAPSLGGSGRATPLLGNAKVEAMLGITRPGGGESSMGPPPAKAPRRG